MSDHLLVSGSEFPEGGHVAARDWSPFGAAAAESRPGGVEEGPASAVRFRDGAPPLAVRPRRREPRYQAIENRLWIQWWQDGELLGRAARLVNVSRNGAMIVSWSLLREHQRVRVFLEEPAHEVGVHAVVLGVCEAVSGMHQFRLRFISPCPNDFIVAAANGFEAWLDCKRPKI